MKEMIGVLQAIEHAVERDFYIKKLAGVLGVRESVVREDLRRADGKQAATAAEVKKVVRGTSRSGAAEKQQGSNQNQAEGSVSAAQSPRTTLPEFERQLLAVLLADEKETQTRLADLALTDMPPSIFVSITRHLAEYIATQAGRNQNYSLAGWVKTLAADQQQLIMDVVADPEWDFTNADQTAKVWQQLVKKWRAGQMQQQIALITQELNGLDQIEQKTPEQELRQQELLAQVVSLRSKA